MQDNPPESNFRPQSPLSLYSYVAPFAPNTQQPVAQQQNSTGAKVQPASSQNHPQQQVVTGAGEEASSATKSILKKTQGSVQSQATVAKARGVVPTPARVPHPTTRPPPLGGASRRASLLSNKPSVQKQPASVNQLPHHQERRKTVVFGRTTPVSQTIEKHKQPVENPLAKSAFFRAKQYQPGLKEMEEIQKQLKSQADEISALRAQNVELVQSMELLSKSMEILSKSMEDVTNRLSEWEKGRQSKERATNGADGKLQSPHPKPAQQSDGLEGEGQKGASTVPNPTVREVLDEPEEGVVQVPVKAVSKERHRPSAQVEQRQPKQQKSQFAGDQGGKVARRDEGRLEQFLGFIGQRIREDPDFEQRINRTVKLFGTSYEAVGEVPCTLPSPLVLEKSTTMLNATIDEQAAEDQEAAITIQEPKQHRAVPLRDQPRGQRFYPAQQQGGRHNETLNTSRPSGYARYTQHLMVHKEITTFSPDRAHLDPHPFIDLRNMQDQPRRGTYRTPHARAHYPAASPDVREMEEDEGDARDGHRPLQLTSASQKRDTVPMSDDEKFFDDNSDTLPQRQKRIGANAGRGGAAGNDARDRYRR